MAKKTGSYLVMLETADKEPPKLISKVKPTEKKNRFLILILHPNTSAVLYEKVHQCADLNEALKLASEIKQKPELRQTQTWFEEKRFIPAPKKGKMKLFTKEAEQEENEENEEKAAKKEKKAKKQGSKTDKEPKAVKKAPKKVKKPEKNLKKIKKKK